MPRISLFLHPHPENLMPQGKVDFGRLSSTSEKPQLLSWGSRRLIYALVLQFLIFGRFAFASDSAKIVAQANTRYKSGDYDTAVKLYGQALSDQHNLPEINFNLGAAQYKKGNYREAASSFEKALLSKGKPLEAKANYNLANSKYKLGKSKQDIDPSSTVALWRQALDYYLRARELNDKDEDARINYDLVKKELEELLEKMKRQEQQQDKDKDKEQSQEQKQQQQDEGQEKQEEKDKQNQEDSAQQQDEGQEKQEGKEERQEQDRRRQAQEEKDSVNQTQAQAQDEKEMSSQEANMLLEVYQQEELSGKIKDQGQVWIVDVEKDW